MCDGGWDIKNHRFEDRERMRAIEIIENCLDWEDALKEIIIQEGLDPADIDLERLSNAFLEYIRRMEELNFSVPARFILVAAILLRLKCESLFGRVEEEERERGREEEVIDFGDVPIISLPLTKPPVRNVSFDELVSTLRKIVEEKEKKEMRKKALEGKIEEFRIEEGIDYERLIIEELRKIGERIIRFSRMCERKSMEEIIILFIALLHLANSGIVRVEQEEIFGEICIYIQKDLF